MNRKDILLNGWTTAYDTEGWYPPLKDALSGLTDEQADWKPDEGAHSIRELVAHLLFYKDRFLHRLEQRDWNASAETNDDTFAVSRSWNEQRMDMARVHGRIHEIITTLPDSSLDQALPEEATGAQVFSLIQHDAYHTGQIVFIRKLQGSWHT